MATTIELIKADITTIKADAIVNAANRSLLGGGGVDGAIHRAAGQRLLKECRKLGGCKAGEAKITGGYDLPAKHVIHAVGPIWHGGSHNEEITLKSCYRNSLLLAKEQGLKSIAFPSISTGVYRFPINLAAPIALKTTKAFLEENIDVLNKVTFVLFSDRDLEIYKHCYNKIF